ncbi:DUF4304 domain-containing protein [Paraburkholderia bannensis]|uniref:DUF4304 domain-containing protein n=1 Tax=Paraburkholderia bannensis TaxID=765414 RepID=UPI002ABD5217|nr:DUF4304 domain-containing protein [Paraburkholderia bannensis]
MWVGSEYPGTATTGRSTYRRESLTIAVKTGGNLAASATRDTSMNRDEMNSASRARFVPALRQLGLQGSLPHYRRQRDSRVDLLTVQFDRHGGGFVVELAQCGADGITTHWGEIIPATNVTAHDLHPRQRHRLGASGPNQDCWFRFDDGSSPMVVADTLCAHIAEAEHWWA